MPLEQIDELSRLEGSDINKAKEILAYEVTKLIHGQDEADKAQSAAHSISALRAATICQNLHCQTRISPTEKSYFWTLW